MSNASLDLTVGMTVSEEEVALAFHTPAGIQAEVTFTADAETVYTEALNLKTVREYAQAGQKLDKCHAGLHDVLSKVS